MFNLLCVALGCFVNVAAALKAVSAAVYKARRIVDAASFNVTDALEGATADALSAVEGAMAEALAALVDAEASPEKNQLTVPISLVRSKLLFAERFLPE